MTRLKLDENIAELVGDVLRAAGHDVALARDEQLAGVDDEVVPFDRGKENPYISDPMIVSKLTTKAQTTIPQPVRVALGLNPGDELVYEIDGDRVILTKVRSGAATDDPFRTFREWETDADTNAYADL